MSGWRVRPARPADATQIQAIHDESWSGGSISRNLTKSIGSYFVLDGTGPTPAFLEFGEWGGWHMVGDMEDHDPDLDDALVVRLLAVAEAWRCRGLGSLLLSGWLALLPENIDYVILDAAPASGPAAVSALQRFYSRQGFRLLQLPEDYSAWNPYLMGWSRPGISLPEAPVVPRRDEPEEEPTVTYEPSPDEQAYVEALRAWFAHPTGPCPSPDRQLPA